MMAWGSILIFVAAAAVLPFLAAGLGLALLRRRPSRRRVFRRTVTVALAGYAVVIVAAGVLLLIAAGRQTSSLSMAVFIVGLIGPALALFFGFLAIFDRFCPTPGRCRGCDYDLRGLDANRCPECGCPRLCAACGHDLAGLDGPFCPACGTRPPLA